MTMLDQARLVAASGVSVIPIVSGAKKAAVEWASFQEHIASDDELVRMFSDGTGGIAAVCGPISGGLELIDFDVPDKPQSRVAPAWKPFCLLLKDHGHSSLLERLIVVESPSGGKHIVYRCPGVSDGNQKLAERADRKALIETRGRGGYFLIPPTEGYKLVRGSFDAIPEITEAERETLLIAARLQNEHYDRVRLERNHPGCTRPGDDYNLRGPELDELLVKHGWKPVRSHGQWRNFTRPGKEGGISAGISNTTGMFHCFTTSTQFDIGKGYSKFSVYTALEHRGDFFHAAQTLKGQGYGGTKDAPIRNGVYDKSDTGFETVDEDTERTIWTDLAEIEELPIRWWWDKRIPLGAITLIQGDPGIGKSTVTHALAATASSGGVLPGGQRVDATHVVLVSSEDDPRRVIKPRLTMMGANLANVSVLATDRKDENGLPQFDVPVTVDMIFRQAKRRGAKLIIIDPVVEFIGAMVDMNSGNQVRPFMARLRMLAELNDCALILVHHQNKNSNGGKALYRAVGSIDFPAACRSVFAVGVDPDNPNVKALAHVKCNWAMLQPSIGYQYDEEGLFGWTGEIDLSADELNMPPAPKAERESNNAAKAWILDQLKDGAMNAEILMSLAKDEGISRRKMFDVKAELGIVSKRRSPKGGKGSAQSGHGYWVWMLKEHQNDPFSGEDE